SSSTTSVTWRGSIAASRPPPSVTAGSAGGAPATATRTSPTVRPTAASTCSSRPRSMPTAATSRSSTSATSTAPSRGATGSTSRLPSATPASRAATVSWKGTEYLLALCEGNRCRAGKEGRKGGGGRIHVLTRKGSLWISLARIKLPKTVDFEDYSAVSIKGDRIAVVSQMDSKLWIGRLRRGTWTIHGHGRIYEFPRTKKGNPRYCTLEGLCWLSNTRFVLV